MHEYKFNMEMLRKDTVSKKEPAAPTRHIPKSLVQLNDSISFESQTAFHFHAILTLDTIFADSICYDTDSKLKLYLWHNSMHH